MGGGASLVKTKGVSLGQYNSELVNYKAMKLIVQNPKSKITGLMGPPIKRVKTGGGNCELRNVGPNEMRKQLRYTCDKRVLPKDPSKYAMQRYFGGTYAAPTLERAFKPGTFALCSGTWVWCSSTIPHLPYRLPIGHEDT